MESVVLPRLPPFPYRLTTDVGGLITKLSTWGWTRSILPMFVTISLTAVVYNNVWIQYNLLSGFYIFHFAFVPAAILSWLWTLLLLGAHHRVEIIDNNVIVARCWFWKSKKLPAVSKKQCQLVVARCSHSVKSVYSGQRWRGYWIELVLPKSRERLVLACDGSEEKMHAAAQELHRATGIRVFRGNAERRFWQCYPMIPLPRLARLLLSQFVFG